MYTSIQSMLLSKRAELYRLVVEKACNELNIAINISDNFIGFATTMDFYLFWLSRRSDGIYFNVRRSFSSQHGKNIARMRFDEDNKDEILLAIDNIYASYLDSPPLEPAFFPASQPLFEDAIPYSSPYKPLWENVKHAVSEALNARSKDVTPIDTEKLKVLGHKLVSLYDGLMDVFREKYFYSKPTKFSIYIEYFEADQVLADIAPRYNVSRERIRQIANRTKARLLDFFDEELSTSQDNAFTDHIDQLCELLKDMDHDAALLTSYGLDHIPTKKKQTMFDLLFGEDLSQKILTEAGAIVHRVDKSNEQSFCDNRLRALWDIYQSKICYPSHFTVDPSLYIPSLEAPFEHTGEKRFYSTLKKFESFIEIIKTPDIIYYSNNTDHRPNFLLKLPNKTSVLVLVVPTVNMALSYNKSRFNALHCFCKERGYGYLIMDDRGNSIYDLKNRVIAPELACALSDMLDKNKRIVWQDIKELSQNIKIRNQDVAAFVLQRNLNFRLSPYCIWHNNRTD